MSVFLRGSIYHYEFMLNGRRYRGSTKQRTETRARRVEDNKRLELMRRGPAGQMLAKAPLLHDVSKEFLDEMEASVKAGNHDADTLRDYRNGCRLLSAHDIWNMRIDGITRGLAARLAFGGGPSTARCAQRTLARLLNWAASEDRGYIMAAPKIRRARYKGRAVRIPLAMQQELLKHMDRDVADVFQLMLDEFLRNSDVLAMRWEDVHLEERYCYIPRGKSEETRRKVPLSDRAVAVLTARKADSISEWVFPRRGKKPKGHRVTVYKQFRKACEAAGYSGVWLYDAKRECATSFAEHGGDLPTLQAAMGHADISTTNKYIAGDSMRAGEVVNQRNRRGLALVGKRA